MNEKELIKKLTLLKTIQPNKAALDGIKKNVYLQVEVRDTRKISLRIQEWFMDIAKRLKTYGVISFGLAFALVLIFFPNQVHATILFGKLALAPNQYARATIALADTKSRFADNNSLNNEFSQSISLTNTELSKLKLKGETGVYTTQQCQQLYREYLSYLEKKEHDIRRNKLQIDTYEEMAEKKLHMYSNL